MIERFSRAAPGSAVGGSASGEAPQQPYVRAAVPSAWVSADVQRSQAIRDRAWAATKQRLEAERAAARGQAALNQVLLRKRQVEMEKSLKFIELADRQRKLEIAKATAQSSTTLHPLAGLSSMCLRL